MIRKRTKIIYLFILVVLTITTLMALYNGGYDMAGFFVAGVAIGTTITSLIPFFTSIYLFKKHEVSPAENSHFKIWGIIIYAFCFPVKIWVIYSNIDLLLNGGSRWAFG